MVKTALTINCCTAADMYIRNGNSGLKPLFVLLTLSVLIQSYCHVQHFCVICADLYI